MTPETLTKLVFVTHAGSTLAMFGLIWFVQLAHYPLYPHVGDETFVAYQAAHMSRTTWVVAPLMLAELFTAGALLMYRPAWVPGWQVWAGLALVGVVWASTMFIQVPRHEILTRGFDAAAATTLVTTNWLRTFAWSARAGLVLWMTYGALDAVSLKG